MSELISTPNNLAFTFTMYIHTQILVLEENLKRGTHASRKYSLGGHYNSAGNLDRVICDIDAEINEPAAVAEGEERTTWIV